MSSLVADSPDRKSVCNNTGASKKAAYIPNSYIEITSSDKNKILIWFYRETNRFVMT